MMNLCCVNTAEKIGNDYQERIDELKNEIRTETTLRLDAEKRIKELESSMQEFVDRCKNNPCNYAIACKDTPNLRIQKTYNEFNQLLEGTCKDDNS
jgi:hypothetical protein